ncbi:MAG: hypothetical protein OEZ36_09970, partial [Spirochaetota bacterium]|nr:hypothetical protein [Spirochaetota bacterium]
RWIFVTAWVMADEKNYPVDKLSGRIRYFLKIAFSNSRLYYRFNRHLIPLQFIIKFLKLIKKVEYYHRFLSPSHSSEHYRSQ